jgi:hypothetical protein
MVKSIIKTWEDIKGKGSEHYKNGGVEPIDLYRALDALLPFGLCSIIKYAVRNMGGNRPSELFIKDMDKIIHYAEFLKADYEK